MFSAARWARTDTLGAPKYPKDPWKKGKRERHHFSPRSEIAPRRAILVSWQSFRLPFAIGGQLIRIGGRNRDVSSRRGQTDEVAKNRPEKQGSMADRLVCRTGWPRQGAHHQICNTGYRAHRRSDYCDFRTPICHRPTPGQFDGCVCRGTIRGRPLPDEIRGRTAMLDWNDHRGK